MSSLGSRLSFSRYQPVPPFNKPKKSSVVPKSAPKVQPAGTRTISSFFLKKGVSHNKQEHDRGHDIHNDNNSNKSCRNDDGFSDRAEEDKSYFTRGRNDECLYKDSHASTTSDNVATSGTGMDARRGDNAYTTESSFHQIMPTTEEAGRISHVHNAPNREASTGSKDFAFALPDFESSDEDESGDDKVNDNENDDCQNSLSGASSTSSHRNTFAMSNFDHEDEDDSSTSDIEDDRKPAFTYRVSLGGDEQESMKNRDNHNIQEGYDSLDDFIVNDNLTQDDEYDSQHPSKLLPTTSKRGCTLEGKSSPLESRPFAATGSPMRRTTILRLSSLLGPNATAPNGDAEQEWSDTENNINDPNCKPIQTSIRKQRGQSRMRGVTTSTESTSPQSNRRDVEKADAPAPSLSSACSEDEDDIIVSWNNKTTRKRSNSDRSFVNLADNNDTVDYDEEQEKERAVDPKYLSSRKTPALQRSAATKSMQQSAVGAAASKVTPHSSCRVPAGAGAADTYTRANADTSLCSNNSNSAKEASSADHSSSVSSNDARLLFHDNHKASAIQPTINANAQQQQDHFLEETEGAAVEVRMGLHKSPFDSKKQRFGWSSPMSGNGGTTASQHSNLDPHYHDTENIMEHEHSASNETSAVNRIPFMSASTAPRPSANKWGLDDDDDVEEFSDDYKPRPIVKRQRTRAQTQQAAQSMTAVTSNSSQQSVAVAAPRVVNPYARSGSVSETTTEHAYHSNPNVYSAHAHNITAAENHRNRQLQLPPDDFGVSRARQSMFPSTVRSFVAAASASSKHKPSVNNPYLQNRQQQSSSSCGIARPWPPGGTPMVGHASSTSTNRTASAFQSSEWNHQSAASFNDRGNNVECIDITSDNEEDVLVVASSRSVAVNNVNNKTRFPPAPMFARNDLFGGSGCGTDGLRLERQEDESEKATKKGSATGTKKKAPAKKKATSTAAKTKKKAPAKKRTTRAKTKKRSGGGGGRRGATGGWKKGGGGGGKGRYGKQQSAASSTENVWANHETGVLYDAYQADPRYAPETRRNLLADVGGASISF
jgi:hypothetical protein